MMVTSFIAACFLMVILHQTPVSTESRVCITTTNTEIGIIIALLSSQYPQKCDCTHVKCPKSTALDPETCSCHGNPMSYVPKAIILQHSKPSTLHLRLRALGGEVTKECVCLDERGRLSMCCISLVFCPDPPCTCRIWNEATMIQECADMNLLNKYVFTVPVLANI